MAWGRIMNRRLVAASVASVLLVLSAAPATVGANPPERQFERLDVGKIDPTLTPRLLSNEPVTVVLQLKGQAASVRKGLASRQRVTVARQLLRTQKGLDARIKAAGGRVLGRYQHAYNGIKVRIPARRIAALAALPTVVRIHGVRTYSVDNARSVPFIGAPQVWEDLGVTGKGETIAVIDTGLDYTHANLGGSGDVADYDDNDPTKIEPGTFPNAKVIGGWDFAGNEYDADGDNGPSEPTPDPDPLDCNGHGSHVAGTAAGNGVLADGTAYGGPYDGSTHDNEWTIGPGVAPEAKLIALKVFGCEGTTTLVVDALDWVAAYNDQHEDDIDVVNMSLGAPLGRADDPDAVATDALVATGVSVVTSSGNEGPNAYVTGAPGVANGAISVAAEDTLETFPGAVIDFASAPDITNANNQNDYPGLPVTGTLKVIYNGAGGLSLGCTKEDYGTLPAGTIVAIQRGVCPFVDKGAAAQAAGAIGVIDINRDDIADPAELPTFIGYTPELFDIPMVGTGRGAKAAIIAADGQTVTLKPGPTLPNPAYRQAATFSSGGPRNGDSATKPDVTAPGVSIVSTLVGGGTRGTTNSGTSMASPHVAGVAALVRATNPTWTPLQVKAAIMNTASAGGTVTSGYSTRVWGAGLVQPRRAVDTVVLATTGTTTASLSYGYDPVNSAYSETKAITFWNTSDSAVSYALKGSSIVTLSDSSITVPAHGSVTVDATASLSVADLAAMPGTSVFENGLWGGVIASSNVVVATPTTSAPGVYQLRVPFTAVPRPLSSVQASARSAYSTQAGIARATVPLANTGIHAGNADVYAWGLSDPQDLPGIARATNDIRAVGVQVLPAEALTGEADPTDRGLVFAVNTWGRWSTASSNEFDIAIYGKNKTKPDYFVVGVDFGAVTAGDINGQFASFVFTAAGDLIDGWVADAPANGSTVLLPVLASEIGQTTANTRFSYAITGFSLEDDSLVDTVSGQGEFDVFNPAVSTGDFVTLDPGETATLDVAVNKGKLAAAPAKGWMIVTLDDPNGTPQADLVPIGKP